MFARICICQICISKHDEVSWGLNIFSPWDIDAEELKTVGA